MVEHLGVEEIASIWDSGDSSTAAWVRQFSNKFYQLELQGMEERIARKLAIPLAELVAVLKLASLSDEELDAISEKNVPRIFWLQLAGAESADELSGVLAKFKGPDGPLPSLAEIQKMLEGQETQTLLDRVRTLSAEDYWYLAKKCKSVEYVTSRERSLLASCARVREKGNLPSIAQAKWATDIIERLVDGKLLVISEFDEDSASNGRILIHLQLNKD